MKRIILIYGIISGAIAIGVMIVSILIIGIEGHSVWLGYLIMITALSLIFLGVKSYRDGELGGVIKFWTAVKVGLGISVVAGIVYVGVWETYLQVSDIDFMDQYATSHIERMKVDGASEREIADAQKRMNEYKAMYENPVMRFGITFLEIFPVALVITLVSAALLRKSSFLPAEYLADTHS